MHTARPHVIYISLPFPCSAVIIFFSFFFLFFFRLSFVCAFALLFRFVVFRIEMSGVSNYASANHTNFYQFVLTEPIKLRFYYFDKVVRTLSTISTHTLAAPSTHARTHQFGKLKLSAAASVKYELMGRRRILCPSVKMH